MKDWISHLEWIITIIVLTGGLHSIHVKIDEKTRRTDFLYEIWCQIQNEITEKPIVRK